MKDTITTEELINLISDELRSHDGRYVADIANQILTEIVNYVGNNTFEIIN